MPVRHFILGLVVGLSCLPSAARAILIEAGGERVGGYLVRDDGKKLTVRVRAPDGRDKVTEYDRASPKVKIKVLHQLDSGRLEKLSRDNPRAYREYAEELAAEKEDPEARDTAMRLFLIAAYLDSEKFGSSSLLAMSPLAGTPAEARKCRAMAFLLDPKADAGVLKWEAPKPAQLPKTQAAALQNFVKALHCYRAGQLALARKVAVGEGVDRIFSTAPGMIDQKAFLQKCADAVCPTCGAKGIMRCAACNGAGGTRGPFGAVRCTTCNGQGTLSCTACEGTGVTPGFSDDLMRTILRAELWALDQLSGGDGGGKKDAGEPRWSSLLQERQVSPVAPLSLETITEFDPRKCLYRNGAWVAP